MYLFHEVQLLSIRSPSLLTLFKFCLYAEAVFVSLSEHTVCWAALRQLRGCEVQKAELDEMLQEQAEAEGRRAQRPWELFTDGSIRWQLISIAVLSSAMQLCGNDSVSKANH